MSYPKEVTRRFLADLVEQFEQGELEVEFLLFNRKDGGIISFTWRDTNGSKCSIEETRLINVGDREARQASSAREISE